MLLVVGLGNPGAEYARQRHNVGYMAVDVIHARHHFGPWKRRFQGELAEGTLAGDKVLLLKPLTFMNDSGRSVQAAAAFYKLAPKDIVVIHDEVDLPPAKVRLKAGGGSAGHNGLRSLTGAMGDDYRRIRIGVGHPGRKEAVPGYVLHDFAKADTKWLVPLLDAIADNAALLAEGKDATLANRIHAALAPEEPDKPPKAKKPDKNGNPPTDGGAAPKGSAAEPAPKKPDKPKKAGQPDEDTESGADNPPPDKPEGPLARGLRKLFGR